MKLLPDENLSPSFAKRLREKGFDAVSAYEVELSGAADKLISAYCLKHSRVLVTLDADFSNVVRYPPGNTSGVIRLKLHPPTQEAIWEVLSATLDKLQTEKLDKRLVVAQKDKLRIRG